MSLQSDRVVVVTGASRGAGRGIAVALGGRGDTVYVTGRSREEGDAPLPGTVYSTAQAVTDAGGRGIPVVCDHADDDQVAMLFEQVPYYSFAVVSYEEMSRRPEHVTLWLANRFGLKKPSAKLETYDANEKYYGERR